MSRICVKNLPKYLTEERLREHFAAKGEVTDAKIIRTRDGQSRQFGFVGFRTEEEATTAVKYFNGSFLDTLRLSCEVAQPIGGSALSRPWSRHSEGSSAYVKSHKASNAEEQILPGGKARQVKDSAKDMQGHGEKNDPQLLEFLQVMQPRSKTKLWANDTLAATDQEIKKNERGHSNNDHASGKKIKTHNKTAVLLDSRHGERKHDPPLLSENAGENVDAQETLVIRTADHTNSVKNKDTGGLVKDAAISDLDYLKSKIRTNWIDEEEEANMGSDEDASVKDEEDGVSGYPGSVVIVDEDGAQEEQRNMEEQIKMGRYTYGQIEERLRSGEQRVGIHEVHKISSQEQGDTIEVVAEEQESVAETGRLFVRNLSYSTSEDDLVELFRKYGDLSQVHLVLDKETKRSKGFAYVLFMLPEAAVRAMEALDKSIFQGRLLHILPANRPPPALEKDIHTRTGGPGMSKFKQKRETQRRETEASGNTHAWNSLFMHPDTIAENVARKYGLSKSDFLNPEAEDLAVRMALGETHIIAETKKALSQEGVNVGILEELASGHLDRVKRSNHVILVKNLPFSTLDTDLVNMFGKFGSLERVILPSTRSLALVVYLEAAEARAAFKSLAYKRFKHVPLYLEWAPEKILCENFSSVAKEKSSNVVVGEDQIKRVVLEQDLMCVADDDVDTDMSKSSSVFVKNLNFKTTEAVLKNHFHQHLKQGALRSATIKMKPSKGGKLLSMGFGFIEFDSAETAKDVCKQLQGTTVDGHALLLQLCFGRKGMSVTKTRELMLSEKEKSSTKMIVRNVAFEATKNDLRQLFSPFGQIKSLRLPKKFDGNHRGFAFVEFVTKQEAENAYNALSSTHLYGRHLVLEQAKEGESLEELRTRTASQFFEVDGSSNHANPFKRRKGSSLIDDVSIQFGQIAR